MSLLATPPQTAQVEEDPGRLLRIAMVAPPWYTIPPAGYGGIETVVAALVDQLVARGHQVTLLSSGEHRTAAQHAIRVFDEPPSELLGQPLPELVAAATLARALRELEVDVVHDHSLAGPLLAAGHRVPTLATMHNPVTGLMGEYYRRLGNAVHLVAISEAERRSAPDLNWVGTVHNAVDVPSFPYRDRKDDYILWLGRYSPDKGAHVAIDAARRLGRRIVVVGTSTEPSHHDYFEAEIRPRLGPDVDCVGEADITLKRDLLAGARCLAFPILWDEPFGMVMIEALACGTPVAAIARGSVPEVIEDGVTGALAGGPDDFADALVRTDEIDPAACRAAAEARFDLPVMAGGYERLYRLLGDGSRSVLGAASDTR